MVAEPFRVIADIRVIRRTLKSKIQRHVQPRFLGDGNKMIKIANVSQSGMDGLMTAFGRAYGPGGSRVFRTDVKRVVWTFSKALANRMDRGEVDHGKSQGRDFRQPCLRFPQGRAALRIPAGRPGEHLIPRSEERRVG